MPYREAREYYESRRDVIRRRVEPIRRQTLDPIRRHVERILGVGR